MLKNEIILKFEKYIDETITFYKIPGLSLAIINNNQIEFAKGYGTLASDSTEIIDKYTYFQAGSIGKTIVAIAILKISESGLLDIDEDVNKYLYTWKVPNNMEWKPKVTTRQLLSHTAGISVHGFGGYSQNDVIPHFIDILEGNKNTNNPPILVDIIPGTQFRYSGGGYCILQQLLMDITKKDFSELIRELVFTPLEMTHSIFSAVCPHPKESKIAMGHYEDGQTILGKWNLYPELAAAGLWSTPSDISKVGIEIQNALNERPTKLISKKLAKEMLSPQLDGRMGLGVFLYDKNQFLRFGHGGATKGFESKSIFYSQYGVGFVGMANSSNGSNALKTILYYIAKEFNWPNYISSKKRIHNPQNINLKKYTGKYILESGLHCIVYYDSHSLLFKVGFQNPILLHPESENIFFMKEVNSEIEFFQENEIKRFVLKQNGTEIKGEYLDY